MQYIHHTHYSQGRVQGLAAKPDLCRLKWVFKAKVWSHMHVKHSYAEW